MILKNPKKACLTNREETTSPWETWVALGTGETRVGSVKLVKLPFTQGRSFPGMKRKQITISANPKRGSDLAIYISKTITSILRHFDQDERESDGSRH